MDASARAPRGPSAVRSVPGPPSGHPLGRSELPKHFVVTGYVLDPLRTHVLLLLHRKLHRWLPPGGHIEAGEDPSRALLREVWEETGLLVRPIQVSEADVADAAGLVDTSEEGVMPLPRPYYLQVETIDGQHEHVDLVYVCEIVGGEVRKNHESEEVRWFGVRDLRTSGVGANVRTQAETLLTRRGSGADGARAATTSMSRSAGKAHEEPTSKSGPARRRTSRSVG